MQFHKILVVAHGDVDAAPALRRAAKLARLHGARLVVMDVIPPAPRGAPTPPGQDRRAFARMLQRVRARELTAVVTRAGTRRAHVVVRAGRLFVEVIRAVQRRGFDLVIKPAEGEEVSRSVLFGSSDLHLLRKCPCPVWLLPPGTGDRCRRIVAAVDAEPGDARRDALSREILALAAELARGEGGKLTVVHAWQVFAEAVLRSALYYVPSRTVRRMGQETRERHRRQLASLLARAPLQDLSFQVRLVRGDPRRVIPRSAHSHRADLVVMGTAGRGGLPGLLIGNTAESVVAQVRCAVLAIKPRDFRTPVRG
jgi:nucleotide-binding universal stress UspA family protein